MMKTPSAKKSSSLPTARFGLSHGYRFEGDFIDLNATIEILDSQQASEKNWGLQLWASADLEQTAVNGVKIAECHFGKIFSTDQSHAELQGQTSTLPPPGKNTYQLFIALVSSEAAGDETIEDFARYPQQTCFVQPSLNGTITCTLNDSSVQITIDEIANPRSEDNLSGTLSLELWSLDAPYTGGNWSGSPVASLILGTLHGGNSWYASEYNASAAVPSKNGHLTLMLREWTPAGYVTRDFRSLFEIQPKKSAAKPASGAKKAAKAKPTSKKENASTAFSVNKATEAELSSVKGLSTAVARAIIASRPYTSLEDLCRAKGMGSKLLAKVREFLTI